MADALASGASDRKIVGVQVPPRPPLMKGTNPYWSGLSRLLWGDLEFSKKRL